MNRLMLYFLAFCSTCLLNSCLMNVHSHIADYGREYEGVILPMDAELPAWRKDDAYYVQGIRTTFERRDTDLYSLLWLTPSGQYKARSGAETDIAYVRWSPGSRHSFTAAPLPGTGSVPEQRADTIWINAPYLFSDNEPVYSCIDELPAAALPAESMMVSATRFTGHAPHDTPKGIVYLTSEARLTSDAIWAYPMAGAAFVLVDVPISVVSILFVPFIEITGNLGLSWFE
ncbi:MAG: hypothetical protein IKY91_00175 [Akkermansia sp.]|nr:hypothetical protein [Akkermansia sp.]